MTVSLSLAVLTGSPSSRNVAMSGNIHKSIRPEADFEVHDRPLEQRKQPKLYRLP